MNQFMAWAFTTLSQGPFWLGIFIGACFGFILAQGGGGPRR
jgi:hypothetical protein